MKRISTQVLGLGFTLAAIALPGVAAAQANDAAQTEAPAAAEGPATPAPPNARPATQDDQARSLDQNIRNQNAARSNTPRQSSGTGWTLFRTSRPTPAWDADWQPVRRDNNFRSNRDFTSPNERTPVVIDGARY